MKKRRPIVCNPAKPPKVAEIVPVYNVEQAMTAGQRVPHVEAVFVSHAAAVSFLESASQRVRYPSLRVRTRYAVKLSDGQFHYVNLTPIELLKEVSNEVQSSQGSQLDAGVTVHSDREAGDELFGTLSA